MLISFRGVLSELQALGHDVQAFEPASSWSMENLRRDGGPCSGGGVHASVSLARVLGLRH